MVRPENPELFTFQKYPNASKPVAAVGCFLFIGFTVMVPAAPLAVALNRAGVYFVGVPMGNVKSNVPSLKFFIIPWSLSVPLVFIMLNTLGVPAMLLLLPNMSCSDRMSNTPAVKVSTPFMVAVPS